MPDPPISYIRQRDLVGEEVRNLRTVVVGAGGIGSFLTLALAKMGMRNLIVCDFDRVEMHNIPNQLYTPEDIGEWKVEALTRRVLELSGQEPGYLRGAVHSASDAPEHDLLITAVDSMRARRMLFENRNRSAWFLDGRMGAEMAWILTVPPEDYRAESYYESKLYSDEEASDEPCTAAAVIYGGFAIGGIIANVVRRIAMRDEPPREVIYDSRTWTLLVEKQGG